MPTINQSVISINLCQPIRIQYLPVIRIDNSPPSMEGIPTINQSQLSNVLCKIIRSEFSFYQPIRRWVLFTMEVVDSTSVRYLHFLSQERLNILKSKSWYQTSHCPHHDWSKGCQHHVCHSSNSNTFNNIISIKIIFLSATIYDYLQQELRSEDVPWPTASYHWQPRRQRRWWRCRRTGPGTCWSLINQSEIRIACVNQSEISIVCVSQSEVSITCSLLTISSGCCSSIETWPVNPQKYCSKLERLKASFFIYISNVFLPWRTCCCTCPLLCFCC